MGSNTFTEPAPEYKHGITQNRNNQNKSINTVVHSVMLLSPTTNLYPKNLLSVRSQLANNITDLALLFSQQIVDGSSAHSFP